MAFDYSSSFAGINNALANIGRQNELAHQRQTLASLGQQIKAGDYTGAAQSAFAVGDAGTAIGILGLGQKQQERDAERQFFNSLGGGATPSVASPGSTAPVAGPASLIQNESGGNWQAQNNAVGSGGAVGHFGRLQFGQARIQDAINAGALPAGTTPQAFMASPELQKRAEAWHFSDIDQKIQQNGFDKLIGQSINGVPVTVDGLRAVAHLGGTEGMKKFVESGGRYNPADRNGTRLSDYFARHGGGGSIAQPQPVQVAENEADVARIEAQMPGYGGGQPAQVAQAPMPGDDPVKLRADAAYYEQSNPEAARQMRARAEAIEQRSGVQVAQAGVPASDVPAPGAANAQGFAIPGTDTVVPQSLMNDPQVQRFSRLLMAAPTERARAAVKGQLDLAIKDAERRSAASAPTEAIRNYRFYVQEERAAGRQPMGFQQFRESTASKTTIKNESPPPTGYRYVRDAEGNIERAEPIPGSKAAQEAEAAAEKKTKADRIKGEVGTTVGNALDDIDRLMASATLPTSGAMGARVASIPGTAAYDISQALTTIGANISFAQLQQMREASPTGGALGAVSDNEQRLLQNSYAALSQSQSPEQFKTNLGRVRATFERIVHGRTLTPQERKTGGPMTMERAKGLRDQAREAIAGGAPRDAVMKRLKEDYGITTDGL